MDRQGNTLAEMLNNVYRAFNCLSDEIRLLGGNDDSFRFVISSIISSSRVRRELARFIVDHEAQADHVFPVILDYDKPLAEMIAAGRYDAVDPEITNEYFRPSKATGKVKVNLGLIPFTASSDLTHYRLATIEQLLAFGVKYPEKQLEFSIVAAGSVLGHMLGSFVPCLSGYAKKRYLRLALLQDGHNRSDRFLLVVRSEESLGEKVDEQR